MRQLKFSRFGIRNIDDPTGKLSIFWLPIAVLTYVSPARGKQRVELPELGFLTTALKKKVRVYLSPALFLVQSSAGDYHFYNAEGEHQGSVSANDAGIFDTFAVDAVFPPLRFISATSFDCLLSVDIAADSERQELMNALLSSYRRPTA